MAVDHSTSKPAMRIESLRISLDKRSIVCLDAEVAKGEVLTLMGPTGCGKSTVLHWLIGALPRAFEASGRLILNDRSIATLPTEQRRIGLLFQDDALFAHMNVGDNLAFALPASKAHASERTKLVEQALTGAGLEGMYGRDPVTLSGGQRARVSVLQTLLAQPDAVLLDEPFSKLDSDRRQQFRAFVFQRIERMGIPALLVSHDQEDVPDGGRVIQLNAHS